MSKVLRSLSTLTDRYQTTIPEPIREVLHLNRRDKIEYIVEDNGKVSLSRAEQDDPIIEYFLLFLVNDIKNHPENITALNSTLYSRAKSLVSDVEIDLNAPLSEKDE